MKKVFISHSSKDRKIVGEICHLLAEYHIPYWISSNKDDIGPGDSYMGKIAAAIRSAEVFLLIASSNSIVSPQVIQEVAIANDNQRRGMAIIAVLVEDQLQPEHMEENIDYVLAGKQQLYWSQAEHREALVTRLQQLLHMPDTQGSSNKMAGKRLEEIFRETFAADDASVTSVIRETRARRFAEELRSYNENVQGSVMGVRPRLFHSAQASECSKNKTVSRFRFTSPPGCRTIVFEIVNRIDARSSISYPDMKLVISTSSMQEDGSRISEFYIDTKGDCIYETNRYLVFLHIRSESEIYSNLGVIADNQLRIEQEYKGIQVRGIVKQFQERAKIELTIEAGQNCKKIIEVGKKSAFIESEFSGERCYAEVFPDKVYYLLEVTGLSARALTEEKIGICFSSGMNGFEKNMELAALHLEKANSPEALYQIGCLFLSDGQMYNVGAALNYWNRAAQAGYQKAVDRIQFLETGMPETFTISDIRRWTVEHSLFALFCEGLNAEASSDMQQAFAFYLYAAEDGFRPAQYRLAECWAEEKGDRERLWEHFLHSAGQACAKISFCTAYESLYLFVNELQMPLACLPHNIESLFSMGDADAVYQLLDFYESARNIEKVRQYTKRLMELCKETPQMDFLVDVAGGLLEISQEEQDDHYFQLAEQLLKYAGANGGRSAIRTLGIRYRYGMGCKKDYQIAGMLFNEAALLGSGTAYWHLGVMYERGLGTDVDMQEAIRCYQSAAERGEQRAHRKLKELQRKSDDSAGHMGQ